MKKIVIAVLVIGLAGGAYAVEFDALAGVKAPDLKAGSAQADGKLIKDAPELLSLPSLPEPLVAQPVFTGTSRWTSSGGGGFSALEQLGVQKSAEERAVLACQQQGLTGCAAVASHITACGSYSCEATAVAKELLTPTGFVRKTVNGASRWTSNGYSGFSALEQLGVRKSAEDSGVFECQKQGLVGCAATASHITNCSGYSCEATAVAVGFQEAAGK